LVLGRPFAVAKAPLAARQSIWGRGFWRFVRKLVRSS
jgi:hypothetical protein